MGYFVKRHCKVKYLMDSTIEVLEDMEYITKKDESIYVEEGYICNGSSIPRIFWRMCGGPTYYKNLRAGIVHDKMYDLNIFPRKKCDEIYYEMLLSEKKPRSIAKLMYWAVRVFGGSHY